MQTTCHVVWDVEDIRCVIQRLLRDHVSAWCLRSVARVFRCEPLLELPDALQPCGIDDLLSMRIIKRVMGVKHFWRMFGDPTASPLCDQAAWGGHLEVLKWLRAHGLHATSRTFALAVARGHLHVVRWIADSNPRIMETLHHKHRTVWHLYVLACLSKNPDLVRWMCSDVGGMVRRFEHSPFELHFWLMVANVRPFSGKWKRDVQYVQLAQFACALGDVRAFDMAWPFPNAARLLASPCIVLAFEFGHVSMIHHLVRVTSLWTDVIKLPLYHPGYLNRDAMRAILPYVTPMTRTLLRIELLDETMDAEMLHSTVLSYDTVLNAAWSGNVPVLTRIWDRVPSRVLARAAAACGQLGVLNVLMTRPDFRLRARMAAVALSYNRTNVLQWMIEQGYRPRTKSLSILTALKNGAFDAIREAHRLGFALHMPVHCTINVFSSSRSTDIFDWLVARNVTGVSAWIGRVWTLRRAARHGKMRIFSLARDSGSLNLAKLMRIIDKQSPHARVAIRRMLKAKGDALADECKWPD